MHQQLICQHTFLILQKEIFYGVVENIIKIIEESANYKKLPFEELEMCVDILVVDAFMRCKIFENPEENK